MKNGFRIERQGDGLYEVVLENGDRIPGKSFSEAIRIAEDRLHPAIKKQEALQENYLGPPVHLDLDDGR